MTVAALVVAALLSQVGREQGEVGFVALFDGRSLSGWQTIPLGENPGTWVARDGVLTHTPGDSWIATTENYTDFILRLEYRTGKETDSGIFLRSPAKGYPSFTGMEFEIRNDPASAPSPRSNTALYGAAAARKNATKADGEWNVVEISLVKRRLVATWNGETIHDLRSRRSGVRGSPARSAQRARDVRAHRVPGPSDRHAGRVPRDQDQGRALRHAAAGSVAHSGIADYRLFLATAVLLGSDPRGQARGLAQGLDEGALVGAAGAGDVERGAVVD